MTTTQQSLMLPGLDGRRALVTGGTRGMGAATADVLARLGARVLVAARSAPDASAHACVVADAATRDGAKRITDEAISQLGGADIIVHCVGASFAKPGGTLALTDDDWDLALSTNLLAATRIDRALLPGMVERGSGVIVHVSSLQWRRPHPSSPAYGPAKAALVSYSKMLATEFGPSGIRVAAVTPGFIATSLADERIGRIQRDLGVNRAEAVAHLLDTIGGVPLGRAGTAEEVAALIAFLASDAASYLTGVEVTIDGGNLRTL